MTPAERETSRQHRGSRDIDDHSDAAASPDRDRADAVTPTAGGRLASHGACTTPRPCEAARCTPDSSASAGRIAAPQLPVTADPVAAMPSITSVTHEIVRLETQLHVMQQIARAQDVDNAADEMYWRQHTAARTGQKEYGAHLALRPKTHFALASVVMHRAHIIANRWCNTMSPDRRSAATTLRALVAWCRPTNLMKRSEVVWGGSNP